MPNSGPDVIVIGAGVIGSSIARRLAGAAARVTVIEAQEPARQATWAAAGMLAPQAEADQPGAFFDLLLEARGRFPALAEALREETGIDVGYRTDGMLLVALSDDDQVRLDARFRWQRSAGLEVERLDPAGAARLEPALSPRLRSALRFPGDHQVDNRLLGRALALAAASQGATFRIGHPVREIGPASDGVRVVLSSGDALQADFAVLAAGSWSGQIRGLPRPLPVEPVHGQLISIEGAPPLMRHVIASPRGYLVPRSDGRLIAGTTVERIGFRSAATVEGLQRITAITLELVPGLADRPIAAQWGGLRPGTPDGLPILGPDPDLPALVYATGHFRNGILLAPLTAEIVSDLILSGRTPLDLTPYRAERRVKSEE